MPQLVVPLVRRPSCTGIYALNHSTLDLILAALFGIAGYLLKRRGFEPAALLLAFVLTPLLRISFGKEHALEPVSLL